MEYVLCVNYNNTSCKNVRAGAAGLCFLFSLYESWGVRDKRNIIKIKKEERYLQEE